MDERSSTTGLGRSSLSWAARPDANSCGPDMTEEAPEAPLAHTPPPLALAAPAPLARIGAGIVAEPALSDQPERLIDDVAPGERGRPDLDRMIRAELGCGTAPIQAGSASRSIVSPAREPIPPRHDEPTRAMVSGAATAAPEMRMTDLEAGELRRGRRRDLDSLAASVLTTKLVFWGPGRSGKTTNVKWLHASLRPELRGNLIDIDGPGERTLYFDSLPLRLGNDDEASVKLRLYTVPGQPRFRLTRKLVLEGVSGIVFVWDARPRRLNANVASLIELRETLAELGIPWNSVPRVFQFNKLDLPDHIPPRELDHVLSQMGEHGPRFEAVAVQGRGVLETLGAVVSAVVKPTF